MSNLSEPLFSIEQFAKAYFEWILKKFSTPTATPTATTSGVVEGTATSTATDNGLIKIVGIVL